MKTFDHGCRCGAVKMRITVPGPGAGGRVVCYCKDCQTHAHLSGPASALLDPGGGTDIWQTTPDHVTILEGAENLAVRRLSPKGLMRWHTTCCNTPMANMMPRLDLPFVGLPLRPDQSEAAEAAFGPVRAFAFTASGLPGKRRAETDQNFKRAGLGLLKRLILAKISGRARQNPFVENGAPIGPVTVISKEQRSAAQP